MQLGYNNITRVGINYFSSALLRNYTLTELVLRNEQMKDEDNIYKEIKLLLKRNKSLLMSMHKQSFKLYVYVRALTLKVKSTPNLSQLPLELQIKILRYTIDDGSNLLVDEQIRRIINYAQLIYRRNTFFDYYCGFFKGAKVNKIMKQIKDEPVKETAISLK